MDQTLTIHWQGHEHLAADDSHLGASLQRGGAKDEAVEQDGATLRVHVQLH